MRTVPRRRDSCNLDRPQGHSGEEMTNASDGKQTYDYIRSGLGALCVLTFGERTAHFLLSSLLLLYLVDEVHLTRGEAGLVTGLILALSYALPVVGGWLGDRWLGARRAMLYGLCLLSASHVLFAGRTVTRILLAIAFFAVGNGLFKPNNQALVGRLYPRKDPRNEGAGMRWFFAINVGGIVGPLIGAAVQRRAGWTAAHLTAAASCFGSALGVLWGWGALKAAELRADSGSPAPQPFQTISENTPLTNKERARVRMLFATLAIIVGWFSVNAQFASSYTIWARDYTDRQLFGVEIGTAQFAALPAVCVVVLGPLAALVASRLRTSLGTAQKVALGLLLSALSAAVMVIAAVVARSGGLVSPLWLVGCFAVAALGELHVWAIGPSYVAQLAPRRYLSLLTGLWQSAAGIGYAVSGIVARLWDFVPPLAYFLGLVGISLAVAGIWLVILPRVTAALGSDDDPPSGAAVVTEAVPSAIAKDPAQKLAPTTAQAVLSLA